MSNGRQTELGYGSVSRYRGDLRSHCGEAFVERPTVNQLATGTDDTLSKDGTNRFGGRQRDHAVNNLTIVLDCSDVVTGKDLEVHLYDNLDALRAVVPAWEELLSGFPAASIFSTWEWLAPWWRAFGNGQRLWVLAFHDSSSQLVALAPLSVGRRWAAGAQLSFARLMGDGSGDSDNLDLPVLPGYEEAFASALLDCLQRESGWDVCQLNRMPDQSPAGKGLFSELQARGWTSDSQAVPWTAILLPESWEAYRQRLSYNERGQLGKYSRRLEKKYQVRMYKCAEEGQLARCLEEFFRLHQMRWESQGQTGSFASPERRQFYDEMARAFMARGWLELWLMELDGKTVGAEFDFRYGDTVYSLQGGFDPACAGDHIGYVLRGHVLQQLIAAGVRRYDFLAGQGGYKDRWGAEVGSYTDLHFARPWTRGSVYLGIVKETRKTKTWLRARIPSRVWTGLHRLKTRVRRSTE